MTPGTEKLGLTPERVFDHSSSDGLVNSGRTQKRFSIAWSSVSHVADAATGLKLRIACRNIVVVASDRHPLGKLSGNDGPLQERAAYDGAVIVGRENTDRSTRFPALACAAEMSLATLSSRTGTPSRPH